MLIPEIASNELESLSDDDLLKLSSQILTIQEADRRANQLRYYQPVSPMAMQVHLTCEKTIGIGGGNGASKTDTALVEMVIRATGQIPLSLQSTYPRSKLRGPIACRVVCESITTTLALVILPKLRWSDWSGVDQMGGERGHFGWVPKSCLIDGDWKKSWNEKLRLLRLYYRDPDDPDRIIGESRIQFMSYDQDTTDFASGDYHFILHDEPPKYSIYRENRARVMRVGGTLMLSMTWSDEPSVPLDWIFDQIYDPAHANTPGYKWIDLFTTDNLNLDQAEVSARSAQMTETEKQVRIYGQPIRFSNRIHPDFTDQPKDWCYKCGKIVISVNRFCGTCEQPTFQINHVQYITSEQTWPVIFVLDPHPRKPHMMAWFQITPNDDVEQVAEASVPGGPGEVKAKVDEIEALYGWSRVRRLIDPNMGRSPASSQRGITWQDEFDSVNLRCDLADDSDIGRSRFNDALKPDARTGIPRYRCDPRNTVTISQIKRYIWKDDKLGSGVVKQVARDVNDDFPTIIKYMYNSDPMFRDMRYSGKVIHRQGTKGPNGY